MRRSDPLGRIYGWIPSVDLLGSVTRVPYLVSLYNEKNTEKLKPTDRNRSKTPPNNIKPQVIQTTGQVSRFYYLFPLSLKYFVRSLYSHTNSYNNAITQCHVDGSQGAWATCGFAGDLENWGENARMNFSFPSLSPFPNFSSCLPLAW